MKKDKKRIGVIGAGGWGTALAALLVNNGHHVTLWSHETEVVNEINTIHTNKIYLNGIELPQTLRASIDPKEMRFKEALILVIPTQFIRPVFSEYKFILTEKIVVNCSKGIEKHSLMRPSELMSDLGLNPDDFCVITGPSHAEEVARNVPTTVVAASDNPLTSKYVQDLFTSNSFRVYNSDDVVGCEIGGALKNVIAIAAGIIDGLELGDNTKAALITRGLAEMSRLAYSIGGKQMTLSGLSGLGDLVVTCNSFHSRNRYVGEQIGKGRSVEDIITHMQMVAEGISTTESAYFLGKKHGVEMPITEQMYEIIFNNVKPLEAIKVLMNRQAKHEWWW
ncbi:MAG: NAD(P)-dependent glycerol-3-phosphate dehydrogenase [Candidatus Kapabacteria bacterium]|nr:NAD(P)-dependent glycerol-3-phosphate dehydrogenase [Candidatus Kapabacteria bacterium]